MTEKTLRTAARYLGALTARDAQALSGLLERAQNALLPAANPRWVVKRLPAATDGDGFELGGLPKLQSPQLCRLFAGAKEGLAAAITLGGEVDALQKRLMLTDPAMGAAVGAYASAYVDQRLNEVMAQEQEAYARMGLRLSPRFSPGYGDVPLDYQRPLTEALECWRIGIRLTDSCLMLPEKSITALCALRADGECPERLGGEHACDRCPMAHCPYREVEE